MFLETVLCQEKIKFDEILVIFLNFASFQNIHIFRKVGVCEVVHFRLILSTGWPRVY